MEKKKRNNATISFTDKSQKEAVQKILRDEVLQKAMPQEIKGKDGLMVLWAVCQLKEFADKGELVEKESDSYDLDIDLNAIALMQNIPIRKKSRIKHNLILH